MVEICWGLGQHPIVGRRDHPPLWHFKLLLLSKCTTRLSITLAKLATSNHRKSLVKKQLVLASCKIAQVTKLATCAKSKTWTVHNKTFRISNSNPMNPTLIRWQGNLSVHTNPSQRAQIPTQCICNPDVCPILEIFPPDECGKHLSSVGPLSFWQNFAPAIWGKIAKLSHSCLAVDHHPH